MDLQDKLTSIVQPASLSCCNTQWLDMLHTDERDSYVLDILVSIIESSISRIPLYGTGGQPADPQKSCQVTQCVPGWKDQVEPFKKDSVFCHGVWKSADSPNKGVLFEIMKKTSLPLLVINILSVTT